jgi:hypothetical protein
VIQIVLIFVLLCFLVFFVIYDSSFKLRVQLRLLRQQRNVKRLIR